MWNGNNPPSQQQRDGYSTTDTNRNADQHRGSRQPSTMIDDQLHMDAVSALTSLQGSTFASSTGVPSQLVRNLSSTNGTMPYVSATAAATSGSAVMGGNPLVQRHYSDDYTALTQPAQPHFDDQLIGSSGLFSHHPYHRPHMYGSTSTLNGGVVGGHPVLHQQQMSAVLSPYTSSMNYGGSLSSAMPTMHAPPVVPTSMSRQTSSSISVSLSSALPSSLHPNQEYPSSGELKHLSSSGVVSSAINHPLHPFDRPTAPLVGLPHAVNEEISKAAVPASSLSSEPDSEYNSMYHPPHPNDRASNQAEKPNDKDDDEDDVEEGDVSTEIFVDVDREDDDTGSDGDQATVEGDGDDDDEEGHEVTAKSVDNVASLSRPRGKPEAAARALAAAKLDDVQKKEMIGEKDLDHNVDDAPISCVQKKNSHSPQRKSSNKKPISRKKSPATANGATSTVSSSLLVTSQTSNSMLPKREFLLGEHVPQISDAEYKNLQEMMIQFCRVPLLSEFSRPVAMLHPEVSLCVWNYAKK
jgi:hypothetical protein